MSTIRDFDNIKNKNTLYHGQDCVKKFCTSLKEHAIILKIRKCYHQQERAKITPRCDRMLHLWKKILKKFADDEIY